MLAPLGVAGRPAVAEELPDEPVGRAGDAEREPLRSRQAEIGRVARPRRDTAAPLQPEVGAVVGADEIAAGCEPPPADRGVPEGSDDRARRAGQERRRAREL